MNVLISKSEFDVYKSQIQKKVEEGLKKNSSTSYQLRKGQLTYNIAYNFFEAKDFICETFSNVSVDPFYNDNKIDDFWSALEKECTETGILQRDKKTNKKSFSILNWFKKIF